MKKMLIVDDSIGWVNHHMECIKTLYPDIFEIDTANSAGSANDLLYGYTENPYDIILTDMQMETDYLPLLAGEWLIEQIQLMKEYINTKIVIISASPHIKLIAEKYNVDYIPKYNCRELKSYRLLENISDKKI